MKNNILLITENLEFAKNLSKKLVLLRNCDVIKTLAFEDALSVLDSKSSYLVFLYSSENQEILEDQIKSIKLKSPNSSLVLVIDKSNTDLVMSMYDIGIDDFILSNADVSEVLIKSVNLMKQILQKEKNTRNEMLLEQINAISSRRFYTELYANEVMQLALESESFKKSAFMILTYDELDRAKFSYDELADAVKSSIRFSDIVIELSSGKFYLLLSDSDCNGAARVFGKINDAISGNFRIKAGICETVGKDFKELEQKTSSVLTDAMLSASDYVIYEEKALLNDEDWILEPEINQKDYKLFKNAFNKKLTKIITPVFYQMQEANEGKLGDTIIEQFTNENQCIFNLKNRKQISRLTLVYPGLGKVVIYVTHSGLDSPENKEIVLSLKELTQPMLTDIMQIFINDFKTCIDNKEA